MSVYMYLNKKELNKLQNEEINYGIPNHGEVYELKATTQKSYYGKAQVIECDCGRYLMSYTTIVAYMSYDGDFKRLWPGYSATTMKHVNDFLRLCGSDNGGKRFWDSLEVGRIH